MGRPRMGDGLLGLFPPFQDPGGVQASGQVAWQGIAEAAHRGYCGVGDVSLFCYGSEGASQPNDSGERIVYVASKRRAVLEALRMRQPVQLLVIWHLALLKLLPFFRLRNTRVALFLHGIEAWQRQSWLARTLLRRVDLFLSNSDYTWQRFTSTNPWYISSPHQTTHLGIGMPLEGNIPSPGTPPVALMLGRLLSSEDYKGHREMIDAWPFVRMRIPEAELWIAGDGDLRGRLEESVAARGLGGTIRFWGTVSETAKQELLAQCRCLALPSRAEGFGLVYLEAMRLGRPCLVSTVDAGREVVNPPEAGLAVDPQRREELVEGVCHLLSDGPAWHAWSRQAQERYAAHFTARHFQDRILSALNP